VHSPKSAYRYLLSWTGVALLASALAVSASAADDSPKAAVEAARRTHDEKQLQAVKRSLNRRSLKILTMQAAILT